jgi:membrane-associated phospholipid phosphatase
VLPEPGSIDRLGRDLTGAWQGVRNIDGWTAGGLLAGSVLSAALLDARADRFASRHAGASWLKAGVRVGNALPWAGLAAAGLLALEPGDPERARTAWTATEAGGASLALALGLKYAVGRARPGETPGTASRNFSPFGRGAHSDAFPSNHTIVAWSVATPFALAYDAPWLYGVAAITNGARVGSRAHWLSDTVASSALGHGVGRIFWQASRDGDRDRPSAVPQVALSPSSVTLAWGW